jgi:ribA/ribD-fused uncharacterized protein
MTQPIFFWGGIYSQWHRSPFTVDGEFYRTAEHFMMAEKARTFGDKAVLAAIMKTKDPSDAKALGRQIQGWSDLVWQSVRFQVVCRGSFEKFRQNDDLAQELRASGDAQIIEASPYDKIWGVGLDEDAALRWYLDQAHGGDVPPEKVTWPGLNLLGKAIMVARSMLTPQ